MELHICGPDITVCEFFIFPKHMHRINSALNIISTEYGRALSFHKNACCAGVFNNKVINIQKECKSKSG